MLVSFFILIAGAWILQSAVASALRILDQTPVLISTALFTAGTVWAWWKNAIRIDEQPLGVFPKRVMIAAGIWTALVCVALWGNCRWDTSTPTAHPVKIIAKIETASRKRSSYNHYKLVVSSWREGRSAETLKTSSYFYHSVTKGQTLQVLVRKGFWGMAWLQGYG